MEKEKIISKYFKSWIDNNILDLDDIFSEEIIYTECYGPEYHGLEQIKRWFIEWNKSGFVIEWSIKRFIHQENISVIEWYFKCNYNDEINGFDGISIVEFDANDKIIRLQEFQSKADHYYPFD